MYVVEVRDRNRRLRGELPWSQLHMVPRRTSWSTWKATVDAGLYSRLPEDAQLVKGGGVVIRHVDDPDSPVMTGLWNGRTTVAAPDGPARALTFTGIDDTWLLARRHVFTDPTRPLAQQPAAGRWAMTGPAESVMKRLVDLNAGPSALAARRIAGLIGSGGQGLGHTVRVNAPIDRTVLDVLAEIALVGGDLGFRLVQLPGTTDLRFDAYLARDRSADVRFSRQAGNLLAGYSDTETAPDVTSTLVRGGDDNAPAWQQVDDVTAESEWGFRAEELVDSNGLTDLELLAQHGDQVLLERGGQRSFDMDPVDGPQARFWLDYRLNDLVTVDEGDGPPWVAPLREIEISVDAATGVEQVTPLIGTPGAHRRNEPKSVRLIRRLTRANTRR